MTDKSIYHEKINLPLYNFKYDIFIGDNMDDIIKHVHSLFSGLHIEIDKLQKYYTCIVKHAEEGTCIMMFFNKKYITDEEDSRNVILRAAVNLSWHILEELDISVNDYITQGYIVEEINREILKVVYKQYNFESNMNNL